MENRIIIFTGPSLHPEEARKILDADYHPPVGRDDILLALRDNPKVIGIIDGVFHQRPAVSHKELLKALELGVKVVGGSSMGALRASELDDMGMIGVGKVYKAYKSGEIESDDDVAVVFDPETKKQHSEALISMNYNFKKASEEGLISQEDLKELNSTAKTIFYPKRTYRSVIMSSNLDTDKKDNLMKYIHEKGVDIKREDARLVLKYIKENLMDE
ncbi:MAG: TfuA-related McrA-glycine thioamidation protein [Methanobacterium sp.]